MIGRHKIVETSKDSVLAHCDRKLGSCNHRQLRETSLVKNLIRIALPKACYTVGLTAANINRSCSELKTGVKAQEI